MKSQVTITEKSSGTVLSKMSGQQFLKAVNAPSDMFVRTAVERFNKENPGRHAEHQMLIKKSGKWVVL